MAAFHYQAQDSQDKPIQGVLEADSARAARAQLRERGLFVLAVQPLTETTRQRQRNGWRLPFRKAIPLSEVSMMVRQLSTLLEAGLPLEHALSVLQEQNEHAAMRQVIAALRSEVLSGHSLAQAMEQHRDVFPDIHRALIRAGEASGELAHVMEQLATYTETQQALQQKIGLAMIYPAIVTVVALLVVGGLLLFVVPQVIDVFQQSHQRLPWLTRMLIGLTELLATGWPYLLAVASGAAVLWHRALQQQAFRFQVHLKLLRVPIAGRLLRGIDTARMASTLAILTSSGVSLLAALHAATGVVSNLPMREALRASADKVREGVNLSRALAGSGLFPPVLIHLIASGEQSGKLDLMLARVAKQQEREVSRQISTLTAILEPALILCMGGVVLLIVLAILQPIIEMNQMIK